MSRRKSLSDEDLECKEKMEVFVNSQANVSSFNINETSPLILRLNDSHVSVLGTRRQKKAFLAVGIPSIKRINGITYLMATLASIVQETSAKDKAENVVVVFLADFDSEYNNRTVAEIMRTYSRHLETGFIQVVRASREFYPTFENLKRNFNDEPQRVAWRAKQVMDYAFMFLYSRNLSEYYIQLEDDVLCGKDFISGVRHYIYLQTKTTTWAMLEFSELGFIGKLFKSSDLEKLARFLTLFYEEQPVDWLMTYFRLSMGQKKVYLRKPTLFQHMGLKSSFDTKKDNKLKDRFFESGDKPWVGDNPPATVISSMPPFEGNTAELAYSSGSGFFWAAKVEAGDAIFVMFEEPQTIRKIVVETGDPKHPDDYLRSGSVFVGSKVGPLRLQEPDKICAGTVLVSSFVNGRALIESPEGKVKADIRCVKILVNESQANWVAFYQIAVFVVR